MDIDADRSGRWIQDLHTELQRGKQVLLYGNICDQHLVNGRYYPFQQVLQRYFEESGYRVIGQYDMVDGVRTLRPEMFETVRGILETAFGGDVSGTAHAANGRHGGRTLPRVDQPGPAMLRPDQALDMIRHVLAQPIHPAAFVVDFSDKLTGDPEHMSEDERRWLVMLRKAIDEAALIRDGELRGRSNILVTVAGQLGGMPPWFYQDNPLVSLVRVGKPSGRERMFFVREFREYFYSDGSNDGGEVDSVFADLTDGMTVWDLEAIARTSQLERLPISRPKALVDFFRYGRVEDPWEQLDRKKVGEAADTIGQDVLGQESAVRAVIDMLVTARVGLTLSENSGRAGKPKGVFFFVGPTGVGKTELAKALSKLIFRDSDALDRYDMSEYAEQHAAEKLAGSPPGYIGYDEGGRLTNRVMSRPFSLLLFDEIEKAHPLVLDKFLQILEDGRLTDGKGQTAYFSQSVIIFTSNIGSDSLSECPLEEDGLPSYESIQQHYLARVRDHFTTGIGRPELLNRLGDNILVFDMLRPDHIDGIAIKFLSALQRSAEERCGIVTNHDASVLAAIQRWMRDGQNMQFGGRRIKSLLDASVVPALNRWVFEQTPTPGQSVTIRVADSSDEVEIRPMVN